LKTDKWVIATAHDPVCRSGLYIEPATAAAPALLDQLLSDGSIRATERVVVIPTGSGLKAGDLITKIRHRHLH